MEQKRIQNLSLGTSDFSALRQFGEIYVDKTELIYELASQKAKYLFVRPRRFGKSLLISTFESLFKQGLKDFKGLAIEKLWLKSKDTLSSGWTFLRRSIFLRRKSFQKGWHHLSSENSPVSALVLSPI